MTMPASQTTCFEHRLHIISLQMRIMVQQCAGVHNLMQAMLMLSKSLRFIWFLDTPCRLRVRTVMWCSLVNAHSAVFAKQ